MHNKLNVVVIIKKRKKKNNVIKIKMTRSSKIAFKKLTTLSNEHLF